MIAVGGRRSSRSNDTSSCRIHDSCNHECSCCNHGIVVGAMIAVPIAVGAMSHEIVVVAVVGATAGCTTTTSHWTTAVDEGQ
jgi:hypothetical protein